LQSSTQVSHESQGEQKVNLSVEAPIQDSGSVSASSNDGRKVSRQDIELVRTLCHLPIFIDFLVSFQSSDKKTYSK